MHFLTDRILFVPRYFSGTLTPHSFGAAPLWNTSEVFRSAELHEGNHEAEWERFSQWYRKFPQLPVSTCFAAWHMSNVVPFLGRLGMESLISDPYYWLDLSAVTRLLLELVSAEDSEDNTGFPGSSFEAQCDAAKQLVRFCRSLRSSIRQAIAFCDTFKGGGGGIFA